MDIHDRLDHPAQPATRRPQPWQDARHSPPPWCSRSPSAIGANSAVFSAIYAVLLRPLPFPNGDELLRLSQSQCQSQEPAVAPVRLEEWNRLNTTFRPITGYYSEDVSELSGELPEKLKLALVAPRFLQVLGRRARAGPRFHGRRGALRRTQCRPHQRSLLAPPLRRRPEGRRKTLRIGRTSLPIVGVMPASFCFPTRRGSMVAQRPRTRPSRKAANLPGSPPSARLKPGVSATQARADLATVQANLGRQFPKTDAEIRPVVEPLKDVTVGGVSRSLWILFGSVSVCS